MSQFFLEKQRGWRFKSPAISLSIVSLLFTALSHATDFITFSPEYINGAVFYKTLLRFPSYFELLYSFLTLVPQLLLIIYLLKAHNKPKISFLVPMIFGVIAFVHLFRFAENYYTSLLGVFFKETVFDIPIVITFILVTINASKGFPKKAYLYIALIAGFLAEFVSAIKFIPSIDLHFRNELYILLAARLCEFLGAISLYIALLLLGTQNKKQAVSSKNSKSGTERTETISNEQALILLRKKLELGIIAEEEYQAQRADIIKKL